MTVASDSDTKLASDVRVDGTNEPRFSPVRDALLENFAGGDEIGAAVSVCIDGKTVVDLWGGHQDAARTKPWERDTIVCMMSVAKGVSALCAHMLVDRGLLDLDKPVAHYWPEFAQAGKEGVLVRWILDHRAGVPVCDAAPPGSLFDFGAIVKALEVQKPLWPPGTQPCYHTLTFGHLVGELVRRLTGKSIGTFVREEISGPLGLDYQISLRPDEEVRCADFIQASHGTVVAKAQTEPDSMLGRAWKMVGPAGRDLNSHDWRLAEIPSGNGHGNARAVARLFGALALGGELDGVTLLSRETLGRAIEEQWYDRELMGNHVFHMGLGFIRNSPGEAELGPNPDAFGHGGAGGSVGFADMNENLGFSYSMNNMHAGIDLGPRCGRLVEAVYRCL